MSHKFPFTLQLDAMDCGPACLRMVARHYGRSYTLQTHRQRNFITREGVMKLGISDAAEGIGFRTTGGKFTPSTRGCAAKHQYRVRCRESSYTFPWHRVCHLVRGCSCGKL